MVYTTYVARNDKGKIYIGQTNNLEKRLKRHNGKLPNKKTSFTSINKGIWKVVYKETFNTRIEAIKREKQLKGSRGRQFIKKTLAQW